jgi:hypothetical protein
MGKLNLPAKSHIIKPLSILDQQRELKGSTLFSAKAPHLPFQCTGNGTQTSFSMGRSTSFSGDSHILILISKYDLLNKVIARVNE